MNVENKSRLFDYVDSNPFTKLCKLFTDKLYFLAMDSSSAETHLYISNQNAAVSNTVQ